MKNKFLIFKLKDCGDEWGVWNKKNQFLGDICEKTNMWVFYPDQMVFDHEIWFSKECLEEIYKKLSELDNR